MAELTSPVQSTLTFLGTGDSLGVPRVYCDCPVCSESRTFGLNRRYRSSLLVQTGLERLFLDCGPDWPTQMEQQNQRSIGQVLITHAHHDHIAGLPQWADVNRWLGVKGMCYAPAEVIAQIISIYSWLPQHIDFVPVDNGIPLHGWDIVPWKVCHGKNGYSFAYRFSREHFHWVYCPDAIQLSAAEKAPLHDLDLLILGTSYYQEPFPMATRSIYDMVEACLLIEETGPRQAYFTHMSHDVDVRKAYPLPGNVGLARTGLKIQLW